MMLTQLIKQNKMLKKIIFKIKKDLYHYKMQLNKEYKMNQVMLLHKNTKNY